LYWTTISPLLYKSEICAKKEGKEEREEESLVKEGEREEEELASLPTLSLFSSLSSISPYLGSSFAYMAEVAP
jgi:hypothetical protein